MHTVIITEKHIMHLQFQGKWGTQQQISYLHIRLYQDLWSK